MARTAPAPNIPAIPGMNPGAFVMGGGGDGGGSGAGGGGAGGGGGGGAGGGKGGANANGGGKGAGGSGGCGGPGACPGNHGGNNGGVAKGDPVDVATGRVFTVPALDLRLPGPLPLEIRRSYSSFARDRDVGLGHGWTHSLGWTVEVGRRRIEVWTGDGVALFFPLIPVGAETLGPEGWVLRREAWGFAVDAGDDVWRIFSAADERGNRYRLTAIDDRNKNRIAIDYDGDQLNGITDSAGRHVRVTSTREGRIASLQVKNAAEQGTLVTFARFTYDDAGDLVLAEDADGQVTAYAYGDDHLLSSHRSPTGLTFSFRYDGAQRCVETWGEYPGRPDPALDASVPALLADGVTRARGVFHVRLHYAGDDYVEVADSLTVQRFSTNAFGKLDKAVSGTGVHTRTYDSRGNIASYTDPVGATTGWERDERGRETAIVNPLGRRTVLDRDPGGRVREIIDPAGHVTRFDRDERGNVRAILNPAGGTSAFEYDEHGLTVAAIAPNGARTVYRRDPHGNCTEVVLPNGASYRFGWDYLGRLTSYTTPLGGAAHYTYSNAGKLLGLRDYDGGVTRYEYDGDGNLISCWAPNGGVYRLAWGGQRMLCRLERPDGSTLAFRFDREGHLALAVNERNEEHRLTYDPAGRLASEKTFDGRELRYRRDAAGHLVRFENGAGEAAELVYDLAGDVIERSFADDTVEVLSYDERGDLVEISDGRTAVSLTRDPLRRVIREVMRAGNDLATIDVEYDSIGNRVARKSSLGHELRIERDAMGHARRMLFDGKREVLQTSNPLGQELLRELPGGGRIESTYDPVGRLLGRSGFTAAQAAGPAPGEPEWVGHRPESATVAQSYRYAVGGELDAVWDQAWGVTEYRYDPIGQLLAAVTSGTRGATSAAEVGIQPPGTRSETFAYDAAGNLLETGVNAPARRYGPGNRLLQRGDTEYAYDGEGRLVEKRTTGKDGAVLLDKYRWNGRGRLTRVERPNGTVVVFDYDPLGRRTEKHLLRPTAGGPLEVVESTRFVWDGDVLVHRLTTAGGRTEQQTFCFEDDRFVPMAHRDGDAESGEWFFYVNDRSGAPSWLLEGTGLVAADAERGAFGTAGGGGKGKTATPLRLQGQYADDETGLSYNRFRYYDAELGRFISPDMLGLPGGFNQYAFGPNPVRSVDPLGLAPSAAEAARAQADKINEQPGKKPNCVTAVVDKETGQVYYGTPGDNPLQNNPALDMNTAHSPLKENAAALPPEGVAPHGQPPGNCGEPKAVNQALANGAKLENLEQHTVYVGGKKHGQNKARCPNCQATTAGVTTTSD